MSAFKILSSDVITNVFEALRRNPALDHDNNIHEYDIHECQGMCNISLLKIN